MSPRSTFQNWGSSSMLVFRRKLPKGVSRSQSGILFPQCIAFAGREEATMDDVIILGAGGHGKVVLDILRAQGAFRPVGFIDDSDSLAGAEVCGIPVIGRFDGLVRVRDRGVRHVAVAIGRNELRVARGRAAEQLGFELVTAVHPTAFVSPRAVVGRGAVVAPNASIVTDA